MRALPGAGQCCAGGAECAAGPRGLDRQLPRRRAVCAPAPRTHVLQGRVKHEPVAKQESVARRRSEPTFAFTACQCDGQCFVQGTEPGGASPGCTAHWSVCAALCCRHAGQWCPCRGSTRRARPGTIWPARTSWAASCWRWAGSCLPRRASRRCRLRLTGTERVLRCHHARDCAAQVTHCQDAGVHFDGALAADAGLAARLADPAALAAGRQARQRRPVSHRAEGFGRKFDVTEFRGKRFMLGESFLEVGCGALPVQRHTTGRRPRTKQTAATTPSF